MAKWRLLFIAIPVVAVVLALRYVVQYVMEVGELVSFGDAGPVITGAALIMGLMLGGVIGDYKESEKIPSALVSNILGIEDVAVHGLKVRDADYSWVHERVRKLVLVVDDWLFQRVDDAAVNAALGETSQLVVDIEKAGAPVHYVKELFGCVGGAANAISRVQTIRNTSFIKSGYALMETLIAVVLGLMVIVTFPSENAQWLIAGAISLVYVFMLLLIKDLDNPFGFGENNGQGSAADVDITPWSNAIKSYR